MNFNKIKPSEIIGDVSCYLYTNYLKDKGFSDSKFA